MDNEAERFENTPSRPPTPDELRDIKRKREAQADQAGYGMIQGATQTGVNQIMDKRIVQSMLHTKAGELRRQAEGLERFAQLMGAASDHDYHLFSTVLAMIGPR